MRTKFTAVLPDGYCQLPHHMKLTTGATRAKTAAEAVTAASLRTKLGVSIGRIRELEALVVQLRAENSALRGELVDAGDGSTG